MQQELRQNNGPSPARRTGSLRFPKTAGLTIHKRKAEEEITPTRRHIKIQSDSHGTLRLTTHALAIPNAVPKTPTVQHNVADDFSHSMIPKCEDRLPPEVDLGLLDIQPRQTMDSVRSIQAGHDTLLIRFKDFPLLAWSRLDREDYLSELLRLEGRCGVSENCLSCRRQPAQFRCDDCFGLGMYCQECVVVRHGNNPLHRLKVRYNIGINYIELTPVKEMEWYIL